MLPYPAAASIGFIGAYAAFGMTSSGFLLYTQGVVSPAWRTVIMGFTSMSWCLGTAALIFGGGFIAASLGYRVLFLTGAGMGLVGLLVFHGYFRTPRGHYAKSSERA
jgi:MFS family permease